MRGGSRRTWQRWLPALVGVPLALFGAGGVAVAAEQIAADAPVPTDPREFGGYYVMSPYSASDPFSAATGRSPGQSTLSDVVPTVSGRLSRVDVFFTNYAGQAYEPPERVMIGWDISPQWQIETDPENTSEVEVRFTSEGPERTRVDLEHRNLDRHGPGWSRLATPSAAMADGRVACARSPRGSRPELEPAGRVSARRRASRATTR